MSGRRITRATTRATTRVVAAVAVAALSLAMSVAPVGAAQRAATPPDGAARYGVGVRVQPFVDDSRRTPRVPALGLPARDERRLPTTIWYPARGTPGTEQHDAPPARGRFPLVVFGHGLGGSPAAYAGLLRRWAAAGYVVAAPDFPVSGRRGGGYAPVADVRSQAGDVGFVIDRVLELDAAPRGLGGLGGIVDRRRVGVSGHSLGAVTALAATFRSCCPDRPIDAVVTFAATPLVHGTDFRGITTPVLLVHGDADPVVSYAGSVRAYRLAPGPAYLLTVPGAGHVEYLDQRTPAGRVVTAATIAFWDRYLGRRSGAAARLATAGDTPTLVRLEHKGDP